MTPLIVNQHDPQLGPFVPRLPQPLLEVRSELLCAGRLARAGVSGDRDERHGAGEWAWCVWLGGYGKMRGMQGLFLIRLLLLEARECFVEV
jgi:hypothetical protein